MKRTCSRCRTTKSATAFLLFADGDRKRFHPWCRDCKRLHDKLATRRRRKLGATQIKEAA